MAVPISASSLTESCSLLYKLHQEQGLLGGVSTVLGIDLVVPRIKILPYLTTKNLYIFCNVNQVNMADTENHSSMLPQPTRSGGVLRALSEMTASDNNTRSAMPPPTATGHKRHGSNLPEPASKRKTLVERAGEPIRPSNNIPQSSIPTDASFQSHNSFNNYRSASNNSMYSYRSNSATTRHTSNSSFPGSVGSGLRAPSRNSVSNLARPKTALAKDRASKAADSRPVTSLGQHGASLELIKNKRMTPFSFPISHISMAQACSRSGVERVRKNPPFASVSRPGVIALPASRRDLSIASQMQVLSLESSVPETPTKNQQSPSRLPRRKTPAIPAFETPLTVPGSRSKSPCKPFLTRWSNTEALDADEHYTNFKRMFEDYQTLYKQTLGEVHEAKNANNLYTTTIEKLEQERSNKTETIITLTSESETLKYRLDAAGKAIVEQRQFFESQIADLKAKHQSEIEAQRQELRESLDELKRDHRNEIKETRQRHDEEMDLERNQRIQAISQVSAQGSFERQKQQMELEMKDHEIRNSKVEIERVTESLERERIVSNDLREALANAGATSASQEATRQALQAKIDFLESDNKSQSEAYAEMERKMNQAFAMADQSAAKLMKEETLRRKLHNQVQELKGNIRVFCRVRPTLPSEEPEELAFMNFPDAEDPKEIEVKGQEEKNSLGKTTTKMHPFSFDRVFDPSSNNNEIFDEISQLIQSALDGFNVCIFAYGQTGSGKTYTMSSEDGMIPKALRQIYSTSKDLEERGWKYTMEGSFVEVYNEEIRDLLGKEGENKKHEIRHDMARCETTITDAVTINLDSQEQVEGILEQAMAKRSVAATSANERSSRSHSVFILRLVGHNSITGEKSKGTLNLVDLAGSERLSHSKVEGARLRETQSINKSLSCLGDVIGALGQQGTTMSAFDPKASLNGSSSAVAAHIPYRNSKLTYLLQFSLGGNSKTLMFVMVAPEKRCLSETLTSLKFADKVGRTRIGVAKKAK